MDKRKELILNTIIKEHIKTGAPVGSEVLVDKYKLGISPATARNEMSALEEDGYIAQPHTSAGRIPTEKAYCLYLDGLGVKKLSQTEEYNITSALNEHEEADFKEAAKILSRISGNAVFWAFHRHNLYYTGISNLFAQPEFSELNIIHDISSIIDRIDEVIDEIYADTKEGVNTLIGSKNPFGNICSTVIAKYRTEDRIGLFGILGPTRMDYEKNVSLVKYIYNKVSPPALRFRGEGKSKK